MNVSGAVASASAMSLANVQAQASISVLRKALDMQASNAAQLLQALPTPAPAPTGAVGTRIDTFA